MPPPPDQANASSADPISAGIAIVSAVLAYTFARHSLLYYAPPSAGVEVANFAVLPCALLGLLVGVLVALTLPPKGAPAWRWGVFLALAAALVGATAWRASAYSEMWTAHTVPWTVNGVDLPRLAGPFEEKTRNLMTKQGYDYYQEHRYDPTVKSDIFKTFHGDSALIWDYARCIVPLRGAMRRSYFWLIACGFAAVAAAAYSLSRAARLLSA